MENVCRLHAIRALRKKGKWERSLEDLEIVISYGQTTNNPHILGKALLGKCKALRLQGQLERAQQLVEEAKREFEILRQWKYSSLKGEIERNCLSLEDELKLIDEESLLLAYSKGKVSEASHKLDEEINKVENFIKKSNDSPPSQLGICYAIIPLSSLYNHRAILARLAGKYPDALSFYRHALSRPLDSSAKAIIKYRIGKVFRNMKWFELARYYVEDSIKTFEEGKIFFRLVDAYDTLASIEIAQNSLKKARDHLDQAFKNLKELSEADGYFLKVHLLVRSGYLYLKEKNFDTAFKEAQKVMRFIDKNGKNIKNLLGIAYLIMAGARFYQNKIQDSTKNYEIALQTFYNFNPNLAEVVFWEFIVPHIRNNSKFRKYWGENLEEVGKIFKDIKEEEFISPRGIEYIKACPIGVLDEIFV